MRVVRPGWLTARGRGPRVGLPVLAGWAALVTGLVVLLARVPVLVHHCLPGDGLVGALGIRLALLQPGVACPSGTVALDADSPALAGLLVVVAVPVVLAHLAAAGSGLALLAVLRGLVRAVAGLARAVLGRVPVPVRVVVASPRRSCTARPVLAVLRAVADDVRRRGPPLVQPA